MCDFMGFMREKLAAMGKKTRLTVILGFSP